MSAFEVSFFSSLIYLLLFFIIVQSTKPLLIFTQWFSLKMKANMSEAKNSIEIKNLCENILVHKKKVKASQNWK